jgi:hypothetical protein
MDMGAVMQELADRLDTIEKLRVFGHPPDKPPSAPAAVVTYPGVLTYDGGYGRGMDMMDPSIVALVGKVSDRTARDRIAKYCAGSGASSFKEVLESGEYETFDSVRVKQVEFDTIAIGAVEYLSATFTLDIVGRGA